MRGREELDFLQRLFHQDDVPRGLSRALWEKQNFSRGNFNEIGDYSWPRRVVLDINHGGTSRDLELGSLREEIGAVLWYRQVCFFPRSVRPSDIPFPRFHLDPDLPLTCFGYRYLPFDLPLGRVIVIHSPNLEQAVSPSLYSSRDRISGVFLCTDAPELEDQLLSMGFHFLQAERAAQLGWHRDAGMIKSFLGTTFTPKEVLVATRLWCQIQREKPWVKEWSQERLAPLAKFPHPLSEEFLGSL